VSSIVTVKSSGDKSLDEHAASMVRSAGPFAPPPAALFRGGVTPVTLPVIYQKQMPQPMIGAPV